MRISEPAPAKLNLALHVRGKRTDGYHELETIFAFCTDGDVVSAEAADALSLSVEGPFADALAGEEDNLVLKAARALAEESGVSSGADLVLKKNLPVASGIGGGSADAAAALRLLTRLWSIDPSHASVVAPALGADVPACLLSMTARGEGSGDQLELVDAGIAGTPVLLVNPLKGLSTAAVFARWNGQDRGALDDWREGRNDLQEPAEALCPAIGDVIGWLSGQRGAKLTRMSGSGATCFALFDDEGERDRAAAACPHEWWNLPTFLR
jgi:4-diphosphocytidyl-2-C-methyl-D-erythritol kinase